MTSEPVYTSTADGFRENPLQTLRHIPEAKPRERKAPVAKSAVERERHCIRCGFRTANIDEFANHVAGELWQARIEIAGDDAEDVDIFNGRRRPELKSLPSALAAFQAWRDSLTWEECLEAQAERQRIRKKGEALPEEVHQKAMEYNRRLQAQRKLMTDEERAAYGEHARAARLERISKDKEYRLEVLPVAIRRDRRKSLGMDVGYVCRKLDIGSSTLNNWETGKSTPEGAMFMRYAELLGVTPPRPPMEWPRGRGGTHKHGSAAKYKRGCRCQRCKDAVAADARDRRHRA